MKKTKINRLIRSQSMVAVFNIFIGLGLMLAMQACGGQDRNPKSIVILVPQSTSALPFLYLADRKMLENASENGSNPGTAVKVESFAQHPQALARLLRGEADFLFTGTTQGWEAVWGGNDLVAISTYVWGVSSLCVKNPDIRSIHDLAGKRIALPFKNSPLDIQTRIILRKAGLDPDKDLQLVYTGFPQALLLLLDGKLEAAAFPEPLATANVRTKNLIRLFEYQKAWQQIDGKEGLSPQVTLFCTSGTAQKMRSFLPVLDQAIGRAIETINANPGEIAGRFAGVLGLPPEILKESLQKTSFFAPEAASHKTLMLSYFSEVRPFFSEQTQNLADKFFFAP